MMHVLLCHPQVHVCEHCGLMGYLDKARGEWTWMLPALPVTSLCSLCLVHPDSGNQDAHVEMLARPVHPTVQLADSSRLVNAGF